MLTPPLPCATYSNAWPLLHWRKRRRDWQVLNSHGMGYLYTERKRIFLWSSVGNFAQSKGKYICIPSEFRNIAYHKNIRKLNGFFIFIGSLHNIEFHGLVFMVYFVTFNDTINHIFSFSFSSRIWQGLSFTLKKCLFWGVSSQHSCTFSTPCWVKAACLLHSTSLWKMVSNCGFDLSLGSERS